jgi:hypothetical protein
MSKWSNRSVDDFETEVNMEVQSRLSSKNATEEKQTVNKNAEDTLRHEGKKY